MPEKGVKVLADTDARRVLQSLVSLSWLVTGY